jgi:hypothetical protein
MVFTKKPQFPPMIKKEKILGEICCSFCGKSKNEVAKMISGPNVFICSECVGLCNDILEIESKEPVKPQEERVEPDTYCLFQGVVRGNKEYVSEVIKAFSERLTRDNVQHNFKGQMSDKCDFFADDAKEIKFYLR